MALLTKDIYRGYKFSVEIAGGLQRVAFQKVSGLKTSVEVVDYREGNMPDRMEKLPGMMTYDAVTLERGLSYDNDFLKWMKKVCDITRVGAGPNPPPSGSSFSEYRKDVTIKLYDKTGTAVKEYILQKAFPSEYSIGDFDASSNDVVISTLVLQHHGIIETELRS